MMDLRRDRESRGRGEQEGVGGGQTVAHELRIAGVVAKD